MNRKRSKEIIEIKEKIKKGIEYLISNQHDDGSIRLNEETRWQVWETANAILAVDFADKNQKKFLEKAVHFLLRAQREDGSFYHTISSQKDDYCMETTAVGILALAIEGKDVSKGVEFMLKNQHLDGSWEIGTPGITKRRFWPSVTGFVLRTLLYLKVSSPQISKGIEFLLRNQQEDGSWGSNWVYYDTAYYPTYIILLALKLYGLDKKENYRKSITFIKENQNNDGSWDENTTDKPRPSRSLRSALALNSLIISPDKSDVKSIAKGIKWLVSNQKSDGHWDGGFFVNWPNKKEDIYTTSQAIYSLKKYGQFESKIL